MHLYLHVPFCKQACYYCDFHFSTNIQLKQEIVKAIVKEIALQKDYLPSPKINSIYFGGGTPSLLTESELGLIFESISKHFLVDDFAEITLEANPDDITISRLKAWKELGINRLSIGIQSFDEGQLKFLNRAHNANDAERCIHIARDYGFENLSMDLIYAIHSESNDIWKQNLEKTIELQLPHVSAYCLTIEPNTVFGRKVKKKKLLNVDDQFAAEQFNLLLSSFEKNGLEQYEISNFARNEMYAKHNTSYWQGEPYLGVGPSAHSFDGKSRQWNIANNPKYHKSITNDVIPFEREILSNSDLVNELIMTGLRTKWGIDLTKIKSIRADFIQLQERELAQLMQEEKILWSNDTIRLTQKGKLFADGIASFLFIE
jgi:oxygen-independent coproporphyrinogen-3 oxidase